MVRSIVAVFDSAAGVYGVPQFVPAVGAAVRGFSDEVNREDSANVLFNHPGDFVLFLLGTFEDSSGEFVLLDRAEQLSRGVDVSLRMAVS